MIQFLQHHWPWIAGAGVVALILWFASTANTGGPRGRSDR